MNYRNSLSDFVVNTQSQAVDEFVELRLQKAHSGCMVGQLYFYQSNEMQTPGKTS